MFDSNALINSVSTYEELQRTRIKFGNRLDAIDREGATGPHRDALAALVERQKKEEDVLRRSIEKIAGAHPLAEWASSVRGLGLLSFGVVVAHLGGDVIHATPKFWVEGEGTRKDGKPVKRELAEGEPFDRTIAQLRSFCGYGDPARRRRAGMSQEEMLACGIPVLKARLRLIAESFLKSSNPTYRPMYDAAKARYKAAHPDWADGHAHNAALRFVVKHFLKDMWLAA